MSTGSGQQSFTKATRLGPYEIAWSIGAGGMGEVFRARDTRLNRDVAVKVLPKEFVADGDRLRRFEQEAKTLAALNHPKGAENPSAIALNPTFDCRRLPPK